MLFSGRPDQACESAENLLKRAWMRWYAQGRWSAAIFQLYARNAWYTIACSPPDEHTVLIPRLNLFYMHMKWLTCTRSLREPKEALPHLNAMVAYAPSYPLAHLKLAVQLAQDRDWDSARAACLVGSTVTTAAFA